MVESLELRIVLSSDVAFADRVAPKIGPQPPSPMAPQYANVEYELDDRNVVNWRIGRWQEVGNVSARNSTLSTSADPSAYFVWYLHELPWRESYDVFVTWPAAANATSQASFELGGLDAVDQSTVSVNQKITPQGPVFQGTTWQRIGSVMRSPVDFVPYIAMSNAAAQGILEADAIRIVPRTVTRPLQFVGPGSQEFDGNESVGLGVWTLQSTVPQPLELAVDVPKGRLHMDVIPLGLQVTGDSRGDSHLILRGTPLAINAGLAGMAWHLPDGKQSDVTLTLSAHAIDGNVSLDDLESQVVTLLYRPTASAPQVHAPVEILVDRGLTQNVNKTWPAPISIVPGSQDDDLWELEITSAAGEIDFSRLLPGQIVNGVRGSGLVRIVDTAERLDAVVQNLVYRPLVAYIHPIQIVLRDPIRHDVQATRSVSVVPHDGTMIAGHPASVAAVEGTRLDLRSLFVVPLPGAVRQYRVQSATGGWENWDPSVALWQVPAVSTAPQNIRVRMLEFESPGSTSPRAIAEVAFDIVAHTNYNPPVLQRWNELGRIEAIEDGGVEFRNLSGYVFGPSPLQYQIATVASNAPRGIPVTVQVVEQELRVTPLPDRYGTATVVVDVIGALGVRTSWPIEINVSPVPDAPRVLVTAPIHTFAEDTTTQRLNISTWFELPDIATSSSFGLISAVSHDPNRLQVTLDGGDLVLIPQPNAFGDVIVEVRSSNATGQSASVPLIVRISPLPDPTQVTAAIPNVDISEDSRDEWIPLDRYFRDDDVAEGGLTYSLMTTSGIPVVARLARDVGGGNYLVVDTIPNATGIGTITVTASDPSGGMPATASVPVLVRSVDDAPYVSTGFGDVSNIIAGQLVSVNLLGHFADVENNPLSYSVEMRGDLLLENLRIENGTEVRFSVRSDLASLPRGQVTHVLVTATDGISRAITSFAVRRDANSAPIINRADEELIFEVTTNSTGFMHQFTASGNGVNRWSLRPGSPSGLSVNVNTGLLTWGQVTSQPGVYFATVDVESEGVRFGRSVVFRVSPGTNGSGQSVQLTNVGLVPFQASPRFRVDEEQQITLLIQADGPRRQEIRYELVSGPGTVSELGWYQWTPDDAAVATAVNPQDYTVFVRAFDGSSSDIESFLVRVYEINYPPVVSSPHFVQFEPDEIPMVTLDRFTASDPVADLGAAAPYFYDLENSFFMEIDHGTGVVSWQPGLESREFGPITHGVRVSARDQGDAIGFGLSHVLLAGERCITSQSCHSVWAPVASDLEIQLYPGEEIDIDVVARQLVSDIDSNAASLRMQFAGYIYDGRYVTEMGTTGFTVMAPANAGGARDIPVEYGVIDNDQLSSNYGQVRVDVVDIRPDIDMDLDQNGIIETADATGLGNDSLWNDDYLEEYRLAPVPLNGPAQKMTWGMDGITAEGVPSELDYWLEVSQVGLGLVELVDEYGSPIPLSFSLESTNVGGTWYVKGIESGYVNITLTLKLGNDEVAFDVISVSVYQPPTLSIDVRLEFTNPNDPWIPVASEDDDNDGLPQRAEGYGLIAPPWEDGGIGSPRMKSVRLRVSDDVWLVSGTLSLEYESSPPERSIVRGPRFGTNGSLPALTAFDQGYLRLWTAAHDSRNATPVTVASPDGDFVAAGPIALSDLTWFRDNESLYTILFVEAVRSSSEPRELTARFVPNDFPDLADAASVAIYPIEIDADLDSDNSNAIGDHTLEDSLEHIASAVWPGKWIRVSSSDSDRDGVADVSDFQGQQARPASDRFVPLKLDVLGPGVRGDARLRVYYNADNPQSSNREGSLRLWTRDGDQDRDVRNVTQGGNFVPGDGIAFAASEIGWNGTGPVTLFMEAVAGGDVQTLRWEVDPDGSGPAAFDSADRVIVRTVFADADVDSDTYNGLERSMAEEAIESGDGNYGQVLVVDSDDRDHDGVPGYAEGLQGIDPGRTITTWPGAPLALELSGLPQHAQLRFVYDASDPAEVDYRNNPSLPWNSSSGVSVANDATQFVGTGNFLLPAGSLRLWRKPVSFSRDPATLRKGGDFISSNQAYRIDEFTLATTNTQNVYSLWIEAVRAPDTPRSIILQIDPDGEGGLQTWTTWEEVVVSPMEVKIVAPPISEYASYSATQPQSLADAYGVVVAANLGDRDGDATPDYADGMNRFGQQASLASAPFQSVQLFVNGPAAVLNDWRLQFVYDASNPADVAQLLESSPYFLTYAPSPIGNMRLWNQDGRTTRSVEDVAQGGNYLSPSTAYLWHQIGESGSAANMYLEGVNRSLGPAVQDIAVHLVRTINNLSQTYNPSTATGSLGAPQSTSSTAVDRLNVTVVEVDLDIDTDRDGAITQLRREDQFEAYQPSAGNRSAFPGQLVRHWPGDIDSDGIPNVFDFSAPAGQIPSPGFTPVRLTLPTPLDLTLATVRFSYPAFPVNSGDPQQGTSGSIRLWNRDGTQNRLPWSIDQGGDMVLPDVTYRITELGNSQSLTLFVEGVLPSRDWADVLLEVSLDPDGPTGRFASYLLLDDDPPAPNQGRATHLASDAVRLTVESVQTVQILATDRVATESQLATGLNGDFAAFTVSRGEQQVQGDLPVVFRLETSSDLAATILTDFVVSASSNFAFDPVARTGIVTIPSGSSSAIIYIHPVDDQSSEWDETVTVDLLPPALSGAQLSPKSYDVGISRAVVRILDDDGSTSVLNQNADTLSTMQSVETVVGDTLQVHLQDGRVRLRETPGTTAFHPSFVGSEGSRPILLMDLNVPTTGTGDRLRFSVRFGSLGVQNVEYPLPSRQAGPVRVALPVDATSLPSGNYDYDVEVHLLSSGAIARTKTVRGRWSVQNLENGSVGDSHFGSGWWVTSLDRITWDDGLPESPSRLTNDDTTYRLARQGARAEQGVALLRGDQTAAWYNLPTSDLQITQSVNDRSSAVSYVESNAANWFDGTNVGGYQGNYRIAREGGPAQVTWNLPLADDAVVQLLTTWVPDVDRDVNATYTIQGVRRVDSAAMPLSWSVQVDQRVTPGARIIDGQPWYSLGFVQAVPGMSLSVVAVGSGQGRLVADAVAVARPLGEDPFETPDGTFGPLLYHDNELLKKDKWGTGSTFDAQRRLVAITDRNGNQTTFAYGDADSDGRLDELSTVREPFGGEIHFHYSNGLLDDVADFANRHTSYSGNTTRNVRLPDPGFGQLGPVTWTTVTDSQGRLKLVLDPLGTATEVVYAGQSSRASRVIEASMEIENAQWGIVSLVEQATSHNALPKSLNRVEQATHQDSRGNVWTYEVDSFGYGTKRINPQPFQATWSWRRDTNGLVEIHTEPAGAGGSVPLPELQTKYQYDLLGNAVREEYADGTVRERRYDPQFSQLLNERDASGREIRYEIDARGNIVLQEERNRSGPHRLTRFVVSPSPNSPGALPGGLVQESTVAADSDDAVTTKVIYYVGGGRNGLPQMQIEAFGTPRARTTEWDYDAARYVNRETLRSTADGDRTTLFVTDPLGRRITRVDQDPGTGDHVSAISSWKYDQLGNRVSSVDSRGSQTFWRYDVRGRLEQQLLLTPGGAPDANQSALVLSYSYDANGNLVATSDGRGITTYDYDERNLKRGVTYPSPNVPNALHGTSAMTWTYDSVGNVAASRGTRSHTENDEYYTTYVYDARHRRTEMVDPEPGTLDHAASHYVTHYDVIGRVEREEYPSASGIVARTYRYDDLDRILQITEPGGGSGAAVTSYDYDLRGNVIGRIDALSRQFVNTYDELDQRTYELWPDTGLGTGAQLWHRVYTDWGELKRLEQTATKPGSATRAWEYEYDRLGRLISERHPDPDGGGVLHPYQREYHYDSNGNQTRVVEHVDARLLEHVTEYDRWNRPWHSIGPVEAGTGTETISLYDRWGQLTGIREKVQASEYRTTDYQYDALGRLIATWLPPHEVGAARAVTQLRHDAAGNVRREIDAAGRVTERFYDRLDRIVSLHEPLDVLGLDDQLAGIAPLSTRDTSYHYFPDGNVELQIDPAGGVTRRAFDNRGKKILEVAPHGESNRWEFDRMGNETLVMDGSGNVTRFVFDALDRQVAEVLYVGNAVLSRNQAYDSMSDLVSVTDRNGREIRYGYDGAGRRVSEQWVGDPSQYSASYQYSARGELTNATDAQSSYAWQYHPSGVVMAQQLHLSVLPNRVFEAVYLHNFALERGSTTWKVNGQTENIVEFERDKVGRVKKVTQSGLVPTQVTRKEVSLNYTIDDQLNSVLRETVRGADRSSAGRSQYQYYNDGLLHDIVHAGREPQGAWNTHTYKYDRDRRVTFADSAQGKTERFGYDAGGQVLSRDTSADAPTGDEAFRYDDSGNREGDVAAHNRLHEDAVGRYYYDREGNVLERWRFELAKSLLPTPDVNGSLSAFVPALARGWYRLRLEGMELLSLANPGPVLVRIGYSRGIPNGSISSWPQFVELSVVQANLVGLGGSRYQLSEGYADILLPVNLIDSFLVVQVERLGAEIVSVSGGVAQWDALEDIQRYTWDYRNRLASAEVLGPDIAALPGAVVVPNPRSPAVAVTAQQVHVVRYVYDVLDERVAKLFDKSTQYSSEVNVSLEGHAVADYRPDGTLLRRHLYGPAVDQLFVTEVVASDGRAERLVWPLTDHLQTVHQLVTESTTANVPLQSQDVFYDAFGEPQGQSLAEDAVQARYTGRPYDRETALSYHRSRYLLLDAGRWLSEDRWWTESGDANRYRYVNNSPMQYTDPSGAYAIPVAGAILVYAARAIGLSAVETGVEAALARSVGDRQFTTQVAFGRNLAVNLAIGWVPGLSESKVGLRATALAGRAVGPGIARAALDFGGRVAVGTAGDAAWSVGVEEQSLRSGITQAFVGNLVGQSLGAGLKYGARSWSAAGKATGDVGDGTGGGRARIMSRSLAVLNPTFIPNGTLPDLIVQQANRRGFATRRNALVLWSGFGDTRSGINRSQAFARANGGTTLEMTPGGRFLDELDLYGPNSEFTRAEASQIWARASHIAANQAVGQVRAVLGAVSPRSFYRTIELPALRLNQKVVGVDELYLSPGIGFATKKRS